MSTVKNGQADGCASEISAEVLSEIVKRLQEKSGNRVVLCGMDDIKKIICTEGMDKVMDMPINKASDLAEIRKRAREVLEKVVEQGKINKIVLCISELSTNVLMHAKKGIFEMYIGQGKKIIIYASDKGKGINPYILEKALFEKGFSTQNSLGCGMKIVVNYSDKVYIYTGEAGTFIVLEYFVEQCA